MTKQFKLSLIFSLVTLTGCVSTAHLIDDPRCKLKHSAYNPFNGKCYPLNVFDFALKEPTPVKYRSWGTAPEPTTTSKGRGPEMAIGAVSATPDNGLGIGPAGGRPSVAVTPHADADGPGSTSPNGCPDVR